MYEQCRPNSFTKASAVLRTVLPGTLRDLLGSFNRSSAELRPTPGRHPGVVVCQVACSARLGESASGEFHQRARINTAVA